MTKTLSRLFFALLFPMLTAFMGSCVTIPETGQRTLLLTSEAQEKSLGAEGYQEVLKKETISKDMRLNLILQRVGKRISRQANKPDYNWEFTLIESDQQNAWCMPGGKVAFYTGILPALQNEAGMAAVMGHEVAHATLRHSGQRISQQQALGIGMSIASLSFANSDNQDLLMGLLGAGATVGILLPYSRSHETEADTVGIKYMAQAGYDPREAVSFWKRFGQTGGQAPPQFLSTHPSGSSRINNLQKLLPEALRLYSQASPKYALGDTL